jgi:putative IMPACT (imprinted ancient) family translation regulator
MLFEDTYKTIAEPADGIYRDKGSKFIAYAYPITQEEQVKPLLASLRAEHSKARHFCWAFRLTADRSIFRLNDDGEPSGTAGRPILNSLLSAELTNLVVVVVRYFGGTLPRKRWLMLKFWKKQ